MANGQLNPIVAQAILGQQAPDILGNFQQGREQARTSRARKLTGQILQQQFGQGSLGQLAEADPDLAVKVGNVVGIPATEKGRRQNYAERANATLAFLNAGDLDGAMNTMKSYKNRMNLMGVPTPTIDQGIQELQTDPQGFQQNMTSLVNSFQQAGILALSPFQQQQGATAGLQAKEEGEIRKEVRKEVRGQLGNISKEASTVKTNFNKIQNLTKEVKKGNRSAVAQSLVALVKLGDPTSVVKDSEMIAALNAQNPLAAVSDLMTSKGVSDDTQGVLTALTRKIDPLNPETVNTDEILATARALTSATVPDIQGRLSAAQEQSEQLTETGRGSLFTKGLLNRVGDLSELIGGQQPQQVAPPAQPQIQDGATATGPNGEKIIFQGGQWRPLNG